MKNSIGREIPDEVLVGREIYQGEFAKNRELETIGRKVKPVKPFISPPALKA